MELSSDFFQAAQDMVLKPDFGSAVILFWFSLVNELVAVLPYVILVSGQLLFLEAGSFPAIISKLFFFIALPAGIGGTVGSFLVYGLAYFGGKPAIERFKKHLRFSWDHIEKVNHYFKGAWYDELIFLALRSVPFLPSLPINATAGVLRMPPLRYFILTVIGLTIRMTIMLMSVGLGVETLAS